MVLCKHSNDDDNDENNGDNALRLKWLYRSGGQCLLFPLDTVTNFHNVFFLIARGSEGKNLAHAPTPSARLASTHGSGADLLSGAWMNNVWRHIKSLLREIPLVRVSGAKSHPGYRTQQPGVIMGSRVHKWCFRLDLNVQVYNYNVDLESRCHSTSPFLPLVQLGSRHF